MTEKVFDSLSQSVGRLAEILTEPKTVANRDSAIKRFELTLELAWKSMKKVLESRGVACQSPRDCLEKAFHAGVIRDDPLWLKMVEDRNLSVHTYDEKLADDIYSRLKDYLRLFSELNNSIGK